jgi:hypothetical protein
MQVFKQLSDKWRIPEEFQTENIDLEKCLPLLTRDLIRVVKFCRLFKSETHIEASKALLMLIDLTKLDYRTRVIKLEPYQCLSDFRR